MFKINWFAKLLMRFAPEKFLQYASKKQGIEPQDIDRARELFGRKHIDIYSLNSQSGRGFIIILDSKLSLHFYQDGDHFYYDGFEIGEYEKGDVTIFDNIQRG
jgi:hypothetical protein